MHNDVPDRSRLHTSAPGRSHALKANLRRARVAGRSSILLLLLLYFMSFNCFGPGVSDLDWDRDRPVWRIRCCGKCHSAKSGYGSFAGNGHRLGGPVSIVWSSAGTI